ncbi:uracil-DNA glycosylase [Pseudogracilibacillus sp. SE30717A]|uniref:uracil-DNA glycosylase n=1 Tax=Pseudogracilibacillus sp. SE30717A TaxID=3098293 RepID=UPI00300E2C4F
MSDFCPVPWPEDPTPEYLIDCKECGLFKHGTRMIWGEGNPNASLMIILDNPGAREDKEGREFVCGTRQALQQAAYEVGLSVQEIYVTYVLKRQPRKKYDKAYTRKICIKHLEEQLKEKQPSLIFCMGNVAVQSFFRNDEAEVKTLRGKIHLVNGFSTAVAYHPLAIRRRPNLRAGFIEDWELVVEEMNKQNFF